MFADYKKWRAETENPPTGGGRKPPYKPFFSLFEEFMSDDPRIHGVTESSKIQLSLVYLNFFL
jgi:hypothetical protein